MIRGTAILLVVTALAHNAQHSSATPVARVAQPPPVPTPNANPSIADLVNGTAQLSTLKAAMTKNPQIARTWLGAGGNKYCTLCFTSKYNTGKTFLAPNNGAFSALSATDLAALVKNTEQFTRVLNEHMIQSRSRDPVTSSEMRDGNILITMAQTLLTVHTGLEQISFINDDGPTKQEAHVVTADIRATNGVMHVIDTVLMPSKPEPQGTTCKPNPKMPYMCPIIDRKRDRKDVLADYGDTDEADAVATSDSVTGAWPDMDNAMVDGVEADNGGYAIDQPRPMYGDTHGYDGFGYHGLDPDEYECEDGLELIPDNCGMMRRLVCAKKGCEPSSVSVWDGYGQCCPEMCAFRVGGAGASCETKRAEPKPVSTVSPPLPVCPKSCSDNFQSCRSKYKADDTCLDFARQGFLCQDAASGAALKCDGTDLLKHAPVCPDVQVYSDCGTCVRTCDRPAAPCDRMCHKGCFCPSSLPLWDAAEEKCIALDACPDVGKCESTIGPNFENTGNTKTSCSGTSPGDNCKGACQSGCVAADNSPAEDKYLEKCQTISNQQECEGNGRDKFCKWASGEPDSSVVFECSDAGDWIVGDIDACSAGGGTAETMCDVFKQTGCLESKCVDEVSATCKGLIKSTVKECVLPCAFVSTSAQQTKCATCIDDSMMRTSNVDPNQGDLLSCCPCLSTNLKADYDFTDSQIHGMLLGTCDHASPIQDDDDTFPTSRPTRFPTRGPR